MTTPTDLIRLHGAQTVEQCEAVPAIAWLSGALHASTSPRSPEVAVHIADERMTLGAIWGDRNIGLRAVAEDGGWALALVWLGGDPTVFGRLDILLDTANELLVRALTVVARTHRS